MKGISKGKAGSKFSTELKTSKKRGERGLLRGRYRIVCKDRLGRIKWVEEFDNLITTEGLNSVLSVYLDGATQIATWYVGLKGTGSPAAGDTLASHSGWSEITSYSGNRKQWNGGTASAGSIDNSASKASFSITGTVTIAGAFLASAATGTTGTLYSVGNFSASRDLISGDTLDVTATFTMADDGV
jgi:hypothetical protein